MDYKITNFSLYLFLRIWKNDHKTNNYYCIFSLNYAWAIVRILTYHDCDIWM